MTLARRRASQLGAEACGTLNAYIHEVKAQTGKSITSAEAAKLIEEANSVEAAIGC